MDHLSDAYERANRPVPPPLGLAILTAALWGVTAATALLILVSQLAEWFGAALALATGCGAC